MLLATGESHLHELPGEQNGGGVTSLSLDGTAEDGVLSVRPLRVTWSAEAKQPVGIVALQNWRRNKNRYESLKTVLKYVASFSPSLLTIAYKDTQKLLH